jgi:hypothetical protein
VQIVGTVGHVVPEVEPVGILQWVVRPPRDEDGERLGRRFTVLHVHRQDQDVAPIVDVPQRRAELVIGPRDRGIDIALLRAGGFARFHVQRAAERIGRELLVQCRVAIARSVARPCPLPDGRNHRGAQ